MPFLANQLSQRLGETPEGYLVCVGARLARSGYQIYNGRELGLQTDDTVEVFRPKSEVLSDRFLASLNGKPVTDSHPPGFVTSANASWYTKGHVQNPRVGGRLESGEVVIIGDLVITDPTLADKIRNGLLREVSCGYEYRLVETEDGLEMKNLLGNHVAVVPTGRAGHDVRIMDAVHHESFDSMVKRFLGRNPNLVKAENDRRTQDRNRTGEPMTKKKLQQLRLLLDELIEEEQAQFARDTGIEPDSAEYAKLARKYLGKPLPRLGASREDEAENEPGTRRGRDSGDAARDFEANCRAVRLRLQRGAK